MNIMVKTSKMDKITELVKYDKKLDALISEGTNLFAAKSGTIKVAGMKAVDKKFLKSLIMLESVREKLNLQGLKLVGYLPSDAKIIPDNMNRKSWKIDPRTGSEIE